MSVTPLAPAGKPRVRAISIEEVGASADYAGGRPLGAARHAVPRPVKSVDWITMNMTVKWRAPESVSYAETPRRQTRVADVGLGFAGVIGTTIVLRLSRETGSPAEKLIWDLSGTGWREDSSEIVRSNDRDTKQLSGLTLLVAGSWKAKSELACALVMRKLGKGDSWEDQDSFREPGLKSFLQQLAGSGFWASLCHGTGTDPVRGPI